jgi:uncharacterized membrane protein YbaN (DUF454 family)
MDTEADRMATPVANPAVRGLLVVVGLAATALGIAGFVVPGLPGTPLLLVAAWAFSMSSDRLYRWTVTNRWFGQAVADYRAGLGITRRIKAISVISVVVMVGLSVGFALETRWARGAVVALGVVGIAFILTRPTRESILETD